MYRRVVLSNVKSPTTAAYDVLYHVNGAIVLSQRRVSSRAYSYNFANPSEFSSVVFPDSVRLRCETRIGDNGTYEFILDVLENQPAEYVEEVSSTGVEITVYNEHGVLVCRNIPKTPASVPGEEPGETTSEPIGGTGEMTSESIGGTGEMTSESIDGTSGMM